MALWLSRSKNGVSPLFFSSMRLPPSLSLLQRDSSSFISFKQNHSLFLALRSLSIAPLQLRSSSYVPVVFQSLATRSISLNSNKNNKQGRKRSKYSSSIDSNDRNEANTPLAALSLQKGQLVDFVIGSYHSVGVIRESINSSDSTPTSLSSSRKARKATAHLRESSLSPSSSQIVGTEDDTQSIWIVNKTKREKGEKKQRVHYKVEDEDGREYRVSPSAIQFVFPPEYNAADRNRLSQYLKAQSRVDLRPTAKRIWLSSIGETNSLDLNSIAYQEKREISLPTRPRSEVAERRWAALSLLQCFPELFARKGNGVFVPKSAASVLMAEKGEERLKERELALDRFADIAASAVAPLSSSSSSSSFSSSPPMEELVARCSTELLGEVQKMALLGNCSDDVRERVLQPLALDSPKGAHELAVALRMWDKSMSPALLRFLASYPVYRLTEDEAFEGFARPLPSKQRATSAHSDNDEEEEDLRVYCIDDSNVGERDDGVAICERSDGGYDVRVHICDVASMIPYESELAEFAQRRHRSIYLPEGDFSMFPRAVSSHLSLSQHTPTLCVSVRLDRNGHVTSSRVYLSRLRSVKHLSYATVNRALEKKVSSTNTKEDDDRSEAFVDRDNRTTVTQKDVSALQMLNTVAKLRNRWRVEQGAKDQVFNMPTQYRVTESSIKAKIDTETPSRVLVAEMMILANQETARFAMERNIPFLYRGQTTSTNVHRPNKATFSVNPSPHITLGVPQYSQVTSPIRRILDLACQWQLVAYFNQQAPPMHVGQLLALAMKFEQANVRILSLEQECARFWGLRQIEEALRNDDHPGLIGTVISRRHTSGQFDRYEEMARVTVPSLGGAEMEVMMSRQASVGEKVALRVVEVNAFENLLRVEEKPAE